MPFTFVKLTGTRVEDRKDLGGHQDFFASVGKELAKKMLDRHSACTAAAYVREGNGLVCYGGGSSRDERLHAEEDVAWQYHAAHGAVGGMCIIPIGAMIIDIEPCHSKRYAGHGCQELFGAHGRQLSHGGTAVTFQFQSCWGHIPCPIFYLSDQPPRGEGANAQRWKSGMTLGEMKEVIQLRFEGPTDVIALGKHNG